MKAQEIVDKVERNLEFKEWKKSNSKSYLAHIFHMIDSSNTCSWQVGYYNPDDTITTFIVESEEIKIVPEEKVFKKTKKKVKRLDLMEVEIDIDKALEIAENFQKEKCKGNEPAKIILVLQDIAKSNIYNISYITKSINLLNMKIDAKNGNIISYDLTPLMQFTGKAS
jgi:hypothetical protein